ncbi:hypothetical protein ENBRE01_2626 [Enteropsectra breve]|nr:hypothetical protein ENBRE01_2626 [Enteropsectra breve]
MGGRYTTTTREERRLIIDAYLNRACAAEIARLFQKPRTTIFSVIKKYLETGEVEASRRGGNTESKLSLEQKAQIKEWIDADCCIIIARLKRKILEEFSISVSYSTIHRAVCGFSYTLKRIYLQPARRNYEASIEARKLYARNFFEFLSTVSDEANVYFVDELVSM